MKIYISADFEGLNGVTSYEQTLSQNKELYEPCRKQLHLELNAVISALVSIGITDITVNDAHMKMDNILLSELPGFVKLISGKPKPVSMMYGLDESFDGVFFIGYHVKAGASKGLIAHTFNLNFKTVKLNDKLISESQLNAIYAGMKKVPIIFASGDDAFCAEIQNDIGDIQTVTTKQAISFSAAMCKPNNELIQELKEKSILAIKVNKGILYKQTSPFVLEVEFKEKCTQETMKYLSHIDFKDDSTLIFKSDDFVEVYKFLQFLSSVF